MVEDLVPIRGGENLEQRKHRPQEVVKVGIVGSLDLLRRRRKLHRFVWEERERDDTRRGGGG